MSSSTHFNLNPVPENKLSNVISKTCINESKTFIDNMFQKCNNFKDNILCDISKNKRRHKKQKTKIGWRKIGKLIQNFNLTYPKKKSLPKD